MSQTENRLNIDQLLGNLSKSDLSGATIALKMDARSVSLNLPLSKSLIKVKNFKDNTLFRYNFLIKY